MLFHNDCSGHLTNGFLFQHQHPGCRIGTRFVWSDHGHRDGYISVWGDTLRKIINILLMHIGAAGIFEIHIEFVPEIIPGVFECPGYIYSLAGRYMWVERY